MKLVAHAQKGTSVTEAGRPRGFWHIECRDRGGNLKWTEDFENHVCGSNYLLDVALSGGTQITTWYMGLMAASPTTSASDTMSSHAGWTEFTAYDESVRQTWTDGGVSSGSVDNSGSAAVFTCSTNSSSVGGTFLTSDSTKSGTTGTLYAAGAFSSNKSLDDGDTLTVTATFTMADDGV